MAFFNKLVQGVSHVSGQVTEFIKPMITTDPYAVEESSPSKIIKWSPLCTDGPFTVYKEGSTYMTVLHEPNSTKLFVLYKVTDDKEAMRLFSLFQPKIGPLLESTRCLYNKTLLQDACNAIRNHESWTAAHIAAKLCLSECFQSPVVASQINSSCEETGARPVHLAVESGKEDLVQEVILAGAVLISVDSEGSSVFHKAAKVDNPKIIQLLASKDKTMVNSLNLYGMSALHLACACDKPENVEQLLRWEADPNKSKCDVYPVHCAMESNSVRCVQVLCKWRRDQIHLQDLRSGGTTLHWASDKEGIYCLTELGCNLDAQNNLGETPLHVMVEKERVECVNALLWRGASAAAVDNQGNTVLHKAIPTDNLTLIQTIIVFGADVNLPNSQGISPRHMAATGQGSNRDKILYMLDRVGALRCLPKMPGCADGCAADGTFNGVTLTELKSPMHSPDVHKQILEEISVNEAVQAAMVRSSSASGSAIMEDIPDLSKAAGDRILCMDGGGIRGLILIQMLLAIEKAAGRPVRQLFDWIAGTSTGGILALAVLHAKSLRYCQGLYFRLKEEVFCGKRPYDSEPLEKFMKREFGETTRMSEVPYPRVMVTGVIADRHPAEFHMFRNYDPPGLCYKTQKENAKFVPPPMPNEQYVWKAARSTGAAPTYFRAMGRFLDGGLMANNPSLDALTEIHEYNMGLKSTSQGHLVRSIHCMVSLGTGKIPSVPVSGCDFFRPGGLIELAQVAFQSKALFNLIIDQVAASEGRPVDRARAWCSMIDVPFFRFSPPLSEEVMMDCTDTKILINMLWETMCYLHENKTRIDQLATVLCIT